MEYLSSDRAIESIRRDPYWPKWDTPWWHMTLLWEMGLAERIPPGPVEAIQAAFGSHYLTFFPLRFEDLPAEIDGYRHVMCHCGLGTIYQIFTECGVDVDREFPWMRPWFLRYQLPDGGLNCNEDAYTKPTPKSSIVSTLPPLEAVLFHTGRGFTLEELEFLDRGADYLIGHRLYRRAGNGEVIFPEWLDLCFPRFYYYDVLRGLRFLARWAVVRGKPLPSDLVAEVGAEIDNSLTEGGITPGRRPWSEAKTLALGEDGTWSYGDPASTFPLLDEAGRTDLPSPWLTSLWESVKSDLSDL